MPTSMGLRATEDTSIIFGAVHAARDWGVSEVWSKSHDPIFSKSEQETYHPVYPIPCAVCQWGISLFTSLVPASFFEWEAYPLLIRKNTTSLEWLEWYNKVFRLNAAGSSSAKRHRTK